MTYVCGLIIVKKFCTYFVSFLLLIYIIMFRLVIVKRYLAYYDFINIGFLLIICLFVYRVFGYRKSNNSLICYSTMQNLIISFIIYYVMIYVLGLFFGFVYNPFSMNLKLILRNLSSLVVFICLREFIRYMIVKGSNKRDILSFVLITLLFSLFDIIMEISGYNLYTGSGIFEFIESSIIPNLALNCMLTYLSYYYDLKCSLFFILLMKTPIYFMPIFPDLGDYFSSVLTILFTFYCYYQASIVLEKYERKLSVVNRKKYSLKILIVFPLLIFAGLVSGLFKYHLFAIGSNSMVPYFSKGDTVLIEKLDKDELDEVKVGDVLAFYAGKVLIVHRITNIEELDDDYLFSTKGDNNPDADNFKTDSDHVYGKVKFVVKYLGIPSIEIRDLLSE